MLNQRDAKFQQKRTQRLADLQKQIAPLKSDRLEHYAIIHRLKFEEVVSGRAPLRLPPRPRPCPERKSKLKDGRKKQRRTWGLTMSLIFLARG